MEKIILEIERQIQRLQAAKKLLVDTQDPSAMRDPLLANLTDPSAAPVKRGRGRPRKHPVIPSASSSAPHANAA